MLLLEDKLAQAQEVQELLRFLNFYKNVKEGNDIFELVSHIDSLETKLNQVMDELADIKIQLGEIQELENRSSLKVKISDLQEKMSDGCELLKQQVNQVKLDVRHKAAEIVQDLKNRGEDALLRVSEFLAVKKSLTVMKDDLNRDLGMVEDIMNQIDESGRRVRQEANHFQNAGRAIAGKEDVGFKMKEGVSIETILKKPWELCGKIYQGMIKRLDAGITKLDLLSERVNERQSEKVQEMGDKHFYNSDAFEHFVNKGTENMNQFPAISDECKRVDVKKR